MLLEVVVESLTIDPDSKTPILVLKSVKDQKEMPIMIGLLEASAIASAIQGIAFDRPMTHDLFKNVLSKMGQNISKVEITKIENNTFYAKIYFISENDQFFIDARPSDAIALALRFKARIYVEEHVLLNSGPIKDQVDIADDSEEGKKWAEYLKKLNPDDFGKYKV